MSVSSVTTLPGQPPDGDGVVFSPLGGDGRSAPLGQYELGIELDGDASGGNATIQLNMDPRYTSLISYISIWSFADAAAGEFMCQILDLSVTLPNLRIVGTLPHVAESFTSRNGGFLWYPPPIWLAGTGAVLAVQPNVDATEDYGLSASIYVFDRNVRQLSAVQWLNMTRVGVNSPIAS